MAASGRDSLERLQGLHQDLVNLTDERLANVDRLLVELESHIESFRGLLDKKTKNDTSRQKLSSGIDTLEIGEATYTINAAFKESAIQVADALDLDEIEAAKLFFQGQEDAEELDRGSLASSIILFHRQRYLTIDSLRLLMQNVQDVEADEELTNALRGTVTLLLHDPGSKSGAGSSFWRKCIDSMMGLEKWQQRIVERVQTVSLTDQAQPPEFRETMAYQYSSLTKQHEILGMIAAYLAKGGHISSDDLRFLIDKVKVFDKHDANLMHYLPPISNAIVYFASSEGACSPEEARRLHGIVTADSWSLRFFQASVSAMWLAEYSGRFAEQAFNSQKDATLEKEAESRASMFMNALKDGALHLMLAICQGLQTSDWYDPARDGFTMFLIQDSPTLQLEHLKAETVFQQMLMEGFQIFVDSFITNMPDTLRKLKFEEDEQRRQMQSRVQLRATEYDLHFERFLILISYAFTGNPEAAESFWSDPDGNLFGFLQWASQRQSTPRAAAFCEMLSALSEGEECAEAAHKFLLQDNPTATGKLRRNTPLSYSHVFRELEFYSSTIKDRPAVQTGLSQRGGASHADQLVEPESAMMLESYLRLLSQIAKNSGTARHWLLRHTSFHIHEHLFMLASSAIESRLRACAFNTLAALLTDKTRDVNDSMWAFLDTWISGITSSPTVSNKPSNVPSGTPRNLDSISNGFEEPNAFVGLLRGLLASSAEDLDASGCLLFPEDLGSAYRMPGIDSYVDFVMGQVFATKSFELHDPIQLRIMRWNCLSFAVVCLESFEEDLIVFANRSNVAVDLAIQASSLAAYARLHPLARVMEWLFNDNVIAALFETTTQDVLELNEAHADSPLVSGVLRGIQAISLIMHLQPTYFDIVRPLIKLQSTNRKAVVANSALASFEDAILNNLDFVSALALYCGSSHEMLAITSLKLLQQLSVSRKLSLPTAGGAGRRAEKSRLVNALERDKHTEAVSRSLSQYMEFDERELEQGAECAGHIIKGAVLKFLNACLDSNRDRPTIAHSLLGFSTGVASLSISEDGLMSSGTALLQTIIRFVAESPWGEETSVIAWLASVKHDALAVLQKLWTSHLSTALTIAELRSNDFLFVQCTQELVLRPDTNWDGLRSGDPEFYLMDSADACATYVASRAILLDYAAVELRSAKANGLSSLVSRIQASLLGSTRLADGEIVNTPSIFDYIDILELELDEPLSLPQSKFVNLADLEACKKDGNALDAQIDIGMANQMMQLRLQEARKSSALSAGDEAQVQSDISNTMQCLIANNKRSEIQRAQSYALKAWITLVIVMLECCSLDTSERSAFILHVLQLTLPAFETSLSEDVEKAQELAQLSRTLTCQMPASFPFHDATLATDAIEERILELLRIGLRGVQSSQSTSALKQTCCQISQTYLRAVCTSREKGSSRRNALRCVRAAGDSLIETLCDDACTGEGFTRTAALLLLESIVTLSGLEQSTQVLQAFDNLNFVQVMVDSLRSLPSELQNASAHAVTLILSYYDATLSLLLRIAQTRLGATFVMNAGFFSAIRQSGLFAADPDIGLDVDNPAALSKYFDLLLGCFRIISAIFLSKGPENTQTTASIRKFLNDNRSSIVGILKRNANIGSVDKANKDVVAELADHITLLIGVSGFLEDDEIQKQGVGSPRIFT